MQASSPAGTTFRNVACRQFDDAYSDVASLRAAPVDAAPLREVTK